MTMETLEIPPFCPSETMKTLESPLLPKINRSLPRLGKITKNGADGVPLFVLVLYYV